MYSCQTSTLEIREVEQMVVCDTGVLNSRAWTLLDVGSGRA